MQRGPQAQGVEQGQAVQQLSYSFMKQLDKFPGKSAQQPGGPTLTSPFWSASYAGTVMSGLFLRSHNQRKTAGAPEYMGLSAVVSF